MGICIKRPIVLYKPIKVNIAGPFLTLRVVGRQFTSNFGLFYPFSLKGELRMAIEFINDEFIHR